MCLTIYNVRVLNKHWVENKCKLSSAFPENFYCFIINEWPNQGLNSQTSVKPENYLMCLWDEQNLIAVSFKDQVICIWLPCIISHLMYVHQPTSDYKPTQMSNKKCSIIYQNSKRDIDQQIISGVAWKKNIYKVIPQLLFDTSLAQNIM